MGVGNCWEIMGCGREAGGRLESELGVCPASTSLEAHGTNGGVAGGRLCWAIAGTLCGGEVQGAFATKSTCCTSCQVFRRVREEEGSAFRLLAPGQKDEMGLAEQFVSITSIVDAISGIVYVADFDTHEILFVNPYAAKLFGEHVVGKRCYEALQTGQTGPCSFCTNARLVVDGQPAPPVVWELRNTVTDRWFMCIDKAIRWWDGRLVRMEVAIDITERKAAEQFRDEYVGLISHDLRNPLNALGLEAQCARRSLLKKGLTEEVANLDAVLESARRMNALIADLLETTRLEAGHLVLERCSLEVDEWAAQTVRRLVPPEAPARLVMQRGDRALKVLADARRLDRVLENLISNALKYSGDGVVTVAVRQDGEEAVVSVSDLGVGLPEDELPHLFKRFFRASTHGGVSGTGLGLYNARLLMEAHGGRIWAESEVGRGSHFHFALPLEPPPL